MPVYNAERYVGEAVESVLAQTFEDFEFLVIDEVRAAVLLKSYRPTRNETHASSTLSKHMLVLRKH